VTPTTAPAGLTGQLTVRGTGSVNFGSAGVSFKMGGQQSANTAVYTFTGAQLQNIFNVSQGQINFNLTSSYNLAARLLLPQYSYRDVFDGFDNSQELFLFQVQAEQGRLIFCYNTGGTSTQSYWVPAGTENTLFGQGVTLQVKLAWSGSSLNLYLNGTLVNTTSYTQATPNWTSTSSFTLGANDPHYYGGGYFSCDDVIGGFQAQNLASSTPALHGDVERGGAIGRVHRGIGLDNTLLKVSASVTVAAGATAAGFTATAGSIASNQTSSLKATLNGSSQSVSIALTAPAAGPPAP
jgi:hypothetical protein